MLHYFHPEIQNLRRIRRLSEFSDVQLQSLAEKLTLETSTRNLCLIECGCCEQFSLYLISGAVIAITEDGNETRFESSDKGELFPIAQLRPSMYQVNADEIAQYIRIYTDQLTGFAQGFRRTEAEMEVVEIEQTEEESTLTIQLFENIMAGKLILPSLPDVAHRITMAFENDEVDAESIGAIVQSDPAITAKLIMTANSALYRGRGQFDSAQQAIVRLGLDTTRNLVMAFAAKELFRGKNPAMKSYMQELWKHSQYVSSLCRLLAKQLKRFDVEQAQLAGLIHDLGVVAILHYAQENEELCDDPELLLEAVKHLRPQITGMLLSQWKFGPEFVTVGEECEDWFRNPNDEPDLCDLVLIAQYHAFIGTPEMKRLPPIPTLPAFVKLGMGNLDIRQINEFMEQSRAEIETVEAHLSGI